MTLLDDDAPFAPPTRPRRRDRRGELSAASHGGVLSRQELRAHGWDRNAVAREVAAERWTLHGRQTVALHTAPLSFEARCWRAVFEVGVGTALIDGVTALQVAGLRNFADESIHVSVSHLAKIRAVPGVIIHKIRRRVVDECIPAGLPRTRPTVAAIRAGHWAVSDRQAATILLMGGQQRLYRASDLTEMRALVHGRTRRKLIDQLIRAVADGVQALGELDVATMSSRRGLPTPSHQIIRHGPRGRTYLDIGWEDIGLFLEIDGAAHRWGLAVSDDNLRANAVTIAKGTALRMDVVGLLMVADEFMDQVCEAHASLTARSRT